jgi:DNA-binding response OmpR family regulator
MTSILVIANDRPFLQQVERGLGARGYDVRSAATGLSGYRMAINWPCDCVILDSSVALRDGLQFLTKLRRSDRPAPVLLLTERAPDDEAAADLVANSEDYLDKPFSINELVARVRALLQNEIGVVGAGARGDDLELDVVHRRVILGDCKVSLTRREFAVFAYLLRHRNATVTREMLGRDVWEDPDYGLTNVIDVYINLLRRKLANAGLPALIQTVRGAGYSLRYESCASASAGS